MASQRLNDLTPGVRERAEAVKRECQAQGFDLSIYCTLRTLEEQARLFRQSRSLAEIKAKMADLAGRGFGFLAEILEAVGPCNGPHVTNAGPGESWHNYAEAFDAVPLVGGKPAWEYTGETMRLWDAYGAAVRKCGLYWAGDWKSFKEFPHAQSSPVGNPLKAMDAATAIAVLKNNGLMK